ncbi:MAG TPA: ATP-dependent RNA helicase DbpA [Myxococcaceae bacterium]|nr:ATP-dependent RNA helicase DbpA [Myxococcaceae bacterium]
MTAFTELSLPSNLSRALEVLEFSEMTPVQEHALPPLLAGRDVTAQARTGSGKTVAFGLGALAAVAVAQSRIQALILCPTRELADQVSAELRRLARFTPNFRIVTLCGGVPCRTQAPSLQIPPHVVVGTPGRILDHLERENLDLTDLRVLVLDEADRMLDMGFTEEITAVVKHTPKKRQTLLFSATFPPAIRTMSQKLQREPVQVTVDATHSEQEIEQLFFEVAPKQKLDALALLLHTYRPGSALVFCHTREDTREVATQLKARGYSVLALHGELEQRERDEVLLRFANGSCTILVATDVAARGLDIKGLPAVIAWELPKDPDLHTHRIGRTGRAGEKGLALNLCSRNERERAELIEERQGKKLTWAKLDLARATELPTPGKPAMVTLLIEGGRQDKLRAGDVLGALTGDLGLEGGDVGKIDVHPARTYVAVRRERSERALHGLRNGKIKARKFKVSALK